MLQDHLLIVATIILFTSIIQSIAGFGFALLAVPLLVLFVDLRQAVILSTLLGTVSNFGQTWQLRHYQHFALFRYGNQSVLKVLLGIAVLFGVWMLARGRDLQNAHNSLDWIMGWLSGVLLMATSTNGPPIVFTLQARRLEPDTQRATLNLIFSITGVFSICVFAITRKIHADELFVALIATPLMLLGVYVGVVLRKRINAELFKKMVLLLLTLGGLSSIASALVG